MSPHKVPSHGNVPFAWEKKPGISKEISQQLITTNFLDLDHHDPHDVVLKLLPPPSRPKISVHHGFLVPPPPGNSTHRVLYRSLSAKGLIRNKQGDEDPFFVAFKECTKNGAIKRGNHNHNNNNERARTNNRSSTTRNKIVSGLRSIFAVEPCKSLESCAVRQGNLERVSHQR